MRRRITRALLATAAAGATMTALGFTAAGAAGAATTGPLNATGHHHGHITFAPSAEEVGTGGAWNVVTSTTTVPCSSQSGYQSLPTNPTGSPLGGAQTSFGTAGCAGYVGSGRNFRYAQAIVRIPQSNVVPLSSTITTGANIVHTNQAQASAPTAWTGLTSNDAVAGLAIMSCYNYRNTFVSILTSATTDSVCPTTADANLTSDVGGAGTHNYYADTTWVAVGYVDTSGGPAVSHAVALGAVNGGDGVKLQVYYPAGQSAHFQVTQNPTGTTPTVTAFQLPSGGNLNAVFNHADALVDYSSSATLTETAAAGAVTEAVAHQTVSPGPASGSADMRITQYQAGGFTTTDGTRGTFTGPWTLMAPAVTSNGSTPPSGTTNVEPAYLWNDGLGSGWGDAFGVWWRH